MKRLHGLASILLLTIVCAAWTIKDTTAPVDIYTGSNTTPTFSAATAGTLTLGLTAGIPGNTQFNTLNGSLMQGGTTTGDGARTFFLGANAYNDSSTTPARIASTGGVLVKFVPRTSDTATALEFGANLAANGTTTAYTPIASATQAGLWTFPSGVKYTASAPAGNVTTYTLSSFEEGTWTPTIAGTGTAGTVTYVQQTGRYQKIGNRVYLYGYVQWSNWAGSPTGSFRISGLPYTIVSGFDPVFSIHPDNMVLPASGLWISGLGNATAATIDLYAPTSGSNAQLIAPASNSGAATRAFRFEGFYGT